jgi:hypothetical protein
MRATGAHASTGDTDNPVLFQLSRENSRRRKRNACDQADRQDDARALIRDLYRCEADILPNEDDGTLTIRVYSMANARSNRAVQHLLGQLNQTEFNYPGTNFKLVFRMTAPEPNQADFRKNGPSQIPGGQEF